MKILKAQRYILSRVDNIGDVVLALPTASILKQHDPSCYIMFLARRYTQMVVQCCPAIDQFLDWEDLKTQSDAAVIEFLQAQHADAMIHLLPEPRLARLARKAKIPIRIGTRRRWYNWWNCTNNIKVTAHDKLNDHECILNLKLLQPFGIQPHFSYASLIAHSRLNIHRLPSSALTSLTNTWLAAHQEQQSRTKMSRISKTASTPYRPIPSNRFKLVIHPGSHGHGREWPVHLFVQLIHRLPVEHFEVILGGSQQEALRFDDSLIAACPQATHLMGKLSLDSYITLIANCDGFIASGTGPLHLAAALGVPTLGLFPVKAGISPVRWRPVGRQAQYLTTHCCYNCQSIADCSCMPQITLQHVYQVIQQWQASTIKRKLPT